MCRRDFHDPHFYDASSLQVDGVKEAVLFLLSLRSGSWYDLSFGIDFAIGKKDRTIVGVMRPLAY